MPATATTWPTAGQHEQAAKVAAQAETVGRSTTDPDQQPYALAVLAGMTQAGQREQAAAVARSSRPRQATEMLAAVAGALAQVGQYEQAITMACSITAPETQAQALTRISAPVLRPQDQANSKWSGRPPHQGTAASSGRSASRSTGE